MVHLISYDISDKTKSDDKAVIALLKQMGAVRCLYSEWLLIDGGTAEAVAETVMTELSSDDGLLVVTVNGWASFNLRNSTASLEILGTA
jgi:hypothetical protein